MSARHAAPKHDDSPEVAALRKKARGQPLSDAERALLANATRKPAGGPTVPHETVESMLEQRRRERR
jgi:hypothetical protein